MTTYETIGKTPIDPSLVKLLHSINKELNIIGMLILNYQAQSGEKS